MNRTCPTPLWVAAGVDVNPSPLRTFGRSFPEAEAIEGSVQSRTVLERCRMLLDGEGDGQCVLIEDSVRAYGAGVVEQELKRGL